MGTIGAILFFGCRLLTTSSTFRLLLYLVRSGTGRGGGRLWRAADKQTADGTKWTEWWRAGGRTEEGDWRAGGCRSRAEVTSGLAGNCPLRLAANKSRYRLCGVFFSFVLTNLVVLFNLKNMWGEGQPHVVNNGVGERIGWTGKRFL